MHLDDVIEKGQATALATEGTIADTRKMSIAVELAPVEDGHNPNVLHMAVLHDSIEDNLPMSIHILKLVPRHLLEEVTHGEDGTRTEPATDVVAGDVIEHRVGRNLKDIVLQLLERADARYLLVRLRVSEDEVAEAHVFFQEVAELQGQHL